MHVLSFLWIDCFGLAWLRIMLLGLFALGVIFVLDCEVWFSGGVLLSVGRAAVIIYI